MSYLDKWEHDLAMRSRTLAEIDYQSRDAQSHARGGT